MDHQYHNSLGFGSCGLGLKKRGTAFGDAWPSADDRATPHRIFFFIARTFVAKSTYLKVRGSGGPYAVRLLETAAFYRYRGPRKLCASKRPVALARSTPAL